MPHRVGTLGAAARAAACSRSVRVRYVAAEDRVEERLLTILALAFDGERWIVATWEDGTASLRLLDVARICRVTLARRAAPPSPAGFDPRDFSWHHWLGSSGGSPRAATIWVDARAAPIVAAAVPVDRISRVRGGGWLYRIHTSRPERLAALAGSLYPCAEVHSPSTMPTSTSSRSTDGGAEARLLRLASWLLGQGEPVTRERIFEAFPKDYRGKPETAEKKFTRDKDALRRLGYVIETVELGKREEQVGYVLSARACMLPRIEFTPDEAALVWSAAVGASRLSRHPLQEDLESALRKLIVGAHGLPPRAAAVEELATDVPPGVEKTLERLVTAWERRKRITIEYWRVATDEVVAREVDVYGWASRRGEWIFAGYCHLRRSVRIFYLSRVRKLRVNGVRAQDHDYEVPKDFDIRRWSRQQVWDYDVHPPRRATVRFTGAMARLARQLLPGATTTLDTEGGRVARLEVRNLRGLVRQVLAWGPEAVLVEPEEGRAVAREILAQMASGTERSTP